MTHFSFAAFNTLDYIILGIILLSIIISFFRGFVHEAISLIVLIIALALALKYSATLGNWFGQYLHSATVRYAIAFLAIFIVVFVVGTIFSLFLHSWVDRVGLGMLDHLLGLVFGALRGVLLVAVLLLLINLSPWANANWLRESALAPKFVPLVTWLHGFLPDQIKNVSTWVSR